MSTTDKSIACESARLSLPGWLTDELSITDRAALDAHLAQCPDCRAELVASQQLWQQLKAVPTPAPGPAMRTRFYAMLDTFEATEPVAPPTIWARLRSWVPTMGSGGVGPRLAYGLLLLGVGVGIGYWLPNGRSADVAYQQRIDTLSVQMQEMREMMMLSLLENPSATERLRAVSYTKDIGEADSRVVEALLTTLNNDPNVNVRLVTLEALAERAHDPRVREGLVQSLTRQESPLVQVALADVMVKLQEKRSLKPLRQMLRQEGIDDLVKTKLEKTIRELS
ncbi:HEAT repeat domain-containing protein [Spirosoma sp. 209]|uniref:HEAT repeat domain-containing protein n=1 Tax=Spirosoma sp. 209 TaxID=1955701 RepID=UPI001F26B1A8|nr:HEAT repeat domain-containing protein [Spirosoma sp. 209]